MQILQNIKAKIKGTTGEKKVQKALKQNNPKNTYIINGYITERDGKTSQIDHIVIRPQGIEVLETKNYNGTIFGKEDEQSWTAHYNKKGNYKIQNPLMQNQAHCKAIQNIVGKDIPIQSTVIFTGKANISSVNYNNVYSLDEYKTKCKTSKNTKSKENNINPKKIYELLQENKANISNRQHVKNIKSRKKES